MKRCSTSGIIEAPRTPLAALGLVACAMLVFVAGGCGGPAKLQQITSEKQFDEEVVKAGQPVVVDFFKGGCAACMLLDGNMDQLCGEYTGRVKFVKFELMKFWFECSCPTLAKRYRIGLYPTVLLIVDGKEKKRWVAEYNGDKYRMVLNEVAPAPGAAPAAPPDATTSPAPSATTQDSPPAKPSGNT